MRRLNERYLLAVAAIAVAGLAAAGGVYWQVERALRGAGQRVELERNLRFTSASLAPAIDSGFEPVSASAEFREAAEFQGRLYVAGPAGLFEFDQRGHAKREFRVGRELPSSPLLRLIPATLADSRQPELLIGTASAGVLAFNGSSFRQIVAERAEARTLTAMLPLASGHLLIGTDKAGLLVYDGRHLHAFHPSLAQVPVTELAGDEADLWIGTRDRGVAHWHGGSADWFDEPSGLPDVRVYAIAVAGERTFVGTSAGIAEFQGGRFARVLASGAFVRSLLPREQVLLAGTMDDGVLEIPLAQTSHRPAQLPAMGEPPEALQLFASGNALYAVTTGGVFARNGVAGWKRVLEPVGGMLSDRNVSALAMDAGGRLWIGYFDRGLDIVEAGGLRARHVEDDHVFCINRILPNARGGATAVATANGLVLFDRQGVRQQVLGRADWLIADHVTDVTLYGDGLAVATPAGLTFMDSGGTHSLYAFHGLVNNHVYAVAARGRQLFAGTLGGASLLEDDQVRASYTTATSALKHNWITAVVPLGEEWWLGTYGAGVLRMDARGGFIPSDGASGDLVINPNALLATDRLLAAGTLGRGLYVLNRESGRWLAVVNGLPSLNVTALAAANGYLYVGTDNGLVRIAEERLAR